MLVLAGYLATYMQMINLFQDLDQTVDQDIFSVPIAFMWLHFDEANMWR